MMKRLNWQDWCIKLDQMVTEKHGEAFSALSRQYDHNAAYQQGKTPEDVIKELEIELPTVGST